MKTTPQRSRPHPAHTPLIRKAAGVHPFFRSGGRPLVQAKCDACGATPAIQRQEEEEETLSAKIQRQGEQEEEMT